MITGIEYHRRRQRLSKQVLAKISCLSLHVIARVTNAYDKPYNSPMGVYIALSDAMGVAVDDLYVMHEVSELGDGDRVQYASKPTRCNCLDVYRLEQGLSYQQLANRLGMQSRQGGQQACHLMPPGAKHLQRLASYEGISVEEFQAKYENREVV